MLSKERYKSIAEDLIVRIREGEFPVNFPSQRELVEEYGTSLRTVTRVMDMLRAKGKVATVPCQGSYVIEKNRLQ